VEQTVDRDSSNVLDAVGRSWGWLLCIGILTLILGVLIVAYPSASLQVIAIFLGLSLFLNGLFRLVMAFTEVAEGHRALWAILGVLSILVGILCLKHVFQTIAILALLLGAYWVVDGIIGFFASVSRKDTPNRGWAIFTSVLAFIAGIVVLVYPIKSAVTLAWVLGLWLIVLGIVGIIGAFMARSEAKKLSAA
jgi:uncharacterized membrane protein HdeD (DUF308 family)